MSILKKLVSVALTAAVVAGIGTATWAADESVNIQKEFKDENLQKIVKKYDSNKDGKLNTTELRNFRELDIWGEDDVKDLTGIDKLTYTSRLYIAYGDMKTIDLSQCHNFTTVQLTGGGVPKTFIAGESIESLVISSVSNLKTLDLELATRLQKFEFIDNSGFEDTIDLSNSLMLESVLLMDLNCEGVKFHKRAYLKEIECTRTLIESLDLSCMSFNTFRRIYLYDNTRLGSIRLPQYSFATLMGYRTSYGYYYEDGNRSIKIYAK